MPEALDLFRRGIDDAGLAGDREVCALGWNRLGEELFRRGDFRGAERPLLEAYRIRKLNHLALDVSYWNLGRLRLEQGDLKSASALLDLAVELGLHRQGVQPLREMYAARSRVRLAEGRLRESLRDARIAVRLARSWRAEPPDDLTRIGSEGILDDIHATLIQAGNRLYLETGDPALIRETFEAVEENRASSLRVLARRRPLPLGEPASGLLGGGGPLAGRGAGGAARRKCRRTWIASPRRASKWTAWRASPARNRCCRPADCSTGCAGRSTRIPLSIASRWGIPLPGCGRWTGRGWRFTLCRRGGISKRRSRRNWLLSAAIRTRLWPPERVYTARFLAASPHSFGPGNAGCWRSTRHCSRRPWPRWWSATGPRTAYLAESHATITIPGAGFWLESAGRCSAARPSRLFLGVGDPITIPRTSAWAGRACWIPGPGDASRPGAALALPRLAASGAELDRSARAWAGERTLLEGGAASARNLAGQLSRRPAVVHLATHILEAGDGHHSGLIALSMRDGGAPELVAPEQIAGWNVDAGVVVLSGCHSSTGDVLPGTGLLGLTRAWLTAGARSVVASQWPTPDDSGPLFDTFYGSLGTRRSVTPGEALRRAQVAMIRTGGWRARPRYWAAYFVVGSE